MKRILKKVLFGFLILIGLVFANGCYYVFHGQFKSVEKLNAGKELNLYECCSIYTMHMAVWMFGWPVSPVAAHECLTLHYTFNKDTVVDWNFNRRLQVLSPKVIHNIKSLTDKPVGDIRYIVWYGDKDYALSSKEHEAAIAINPCTVTKAALMDDGTPLYLIHSSMQYPKESRTSFNLGKFTLVLNEGLFRHLQDRGWLGYYTVEYGIYGSWIANL